MDKQKLLNNKKFQIKIKKNIPQEAGLGGGSMNAANILNFLLKKKFIKLNQKKILKITNSIGSDVILGVNPISTVLSSKNVIKKFSKVLNLYFACTSKILDVLQKKFIQE